MSDDPRYPIGHFQMPTSSSSGDRAGWIKDIEQLPAQLRSAASGLSDAQLDVPYRDGGWSVRQVVHHIPDSHLNAYVRFKLALTEEHPLIRPYDEKSWAELADSREAPIAMSLTLVESLHARWVHALRDLSEDAWDRTFEHPIGGTFSLMKALATYSWHGRHHIAHITSLRSRKGW